MEKLNIITGEVVDAAYKIHSSLGPGLLESVYELLLARDLSGRGLHVDRQKSVPIEFNHVKFEEAFRADLLVENAVIVEVKSVEKLALVHEKQLLTYMKLLDYRLGLLINFNVPYIKDGIRRLAYKL